MFNHMVDTIICTLGSICVYLITHYTAYYMPSDTNQISMALIFSVFICAFICVILTIIMAVIICDIIDTNHIDRPEHLRYLVVRLIAIMIVFSSLIVGMYYSTVQPTDTMVWIHYIVWWSLSKVSILFVFGIIYYSTLPRR